MPLPSQENLTMATTKTETAKEIKEEINLSPVPDASKKVTIKLPRLRNNAEDVFVGVNGKTFLIKRGVEVEVPYYVAEVIEQSELAQEKTDEYTSANER